MSTNAIDGWQSFLDAIDTQPGEPPSQPGNDEPANFISPLSHYRLLAINGPDSSKFLQGQTSCNMQEVSEEQSRPGVYCTPKGRAICNFHIACKPLAEDCLLLRMDAGLVTLCQQRLGKYIVFSDAKLCDASEAFIIIGVQGPRAKAALEQLFDKLPACHFASTSSELGVVIQQDDEGHRYECWLPVASALQSWQQLAELLPVGTSEGWQRQSIALGLADISTATSELFIPQMLNYQLTGHISFNKGCYTGQEVVARMQYRGKTKRRLYRARLAANAPAAGAALYSLQGEQGEQKVQSVGTVVNAVNDPAGGCEVLAVISDAQIVEQGIFLQEKGPQLEILSLPYAINNDT